MNVFDYIMDCEQLPDGAIVCADCRCPLVQVSGLYSTPTEHRDFEAEGCSSCGKSQILNMRALVSEGYRLEYGTFENAMRGEADSTRNVYDALTAMEMDEIDFREHVAGLLRIASA